MSNALSGFAIADLAALTKEKNVISTALRY